MATALPRLQLLRGLAPQKQQKEQLTTARLRLELIVSSEFNDPIPGMMQQMVYSASWVPSFVVGVGGSASVQEHKAIFIMVRQRGEVGVFDVQAPISLGSFQLHICATQVSSQSRTTSGEGGADESSAAQMMLSLYTDAVTVLPAIEQATKLLALTGTMLSVYRRWQPTELSCAAGLALPALTVREEYGATLGSHIYDCALVLIDFLRREMKQSASTTRAAAAVELGSGCGLVGLALSFLCPSLYSRVYLTDKTCQLNMLNDNIELSGRGESCRAVALDWASASDFDALKAHLDSDAEHPLGMIVAADVLYDKEAAALLLGVIHDLCYHSRPSSVPRILIAQRLRSDTQQLELGRFAGIFQYDVLEEDRGVRILELTLHVK